MPLVFLSAYVTFPPTSENQRAQHRRIEAEMEGDTVHTIDGTPRLALEE